jgi:hypothetical protein
VEKGDGLEAGDLIVIIDQKQAEGGAPAPADAPGKAVAMA